MIVAFDVDGTLIDFEDNPREHIVNLARALIGAGVDVVVWSGGGLSYAEMWRDRLELQGATAAAKFGTRLFHVDLAIDDEQQFLPPLVSQVLVVGKSVK